MSVFKASISDSFKSAYNTIKIYPTTILSALLFTLVTMVRIQMDYPLQEDYNYLFNCLHMSFAGTVAVSFLAMAYCRSRINTKRSYLIANFIGLGTFALLFVSLFFIGSADTYNRISEISTVRVTSIIFVSLIIFTYVSGYYDKKTHYSSALFMFQKAFIISALYGMVIGSGVSSTAAAFKALLYRDMSDKVFMYVAALTGFVAFTIFIGYFPDLSKSTLVKKRANAQKQPSFIKILFEYIMIPIVATLGLVLVLWVVKTIFTSDWPNFGRLVGIVSSYTIAGIWLHIMVDKYETQIAKVYKKNFPVVSILILIFGLWGYIKEINQYGFMTEEYTFGLLWIFSMVASLALIIRKEQAHLIMTVVLSALIVMSVLPIVGYHELPVRMQINRLEQMLESNEMLVDDMIVPAGDTLDEATRIAMTLAVDFIAYQDEVTKPQWFKEDLQHSDVFEKTLGFEKQRPTYNDYDDIRVAYKGMRLQLPESAIDIRDYDYSVNFEPYRSDDRVVKIKGNQGSYTIYWINDFDYGRPKLKVRRDDELLVEDDFDAYLDRVNEQWDNDAPQTEDLIHRIETDELSIMVVFRTIDVNVDVESDYISHFMEVKSIFFKEK